MFEEIGIIWHQWHLSRDFYRKLRYGLKLIRPDKVLSHYFFCFLNFCHVCDSIRLNVQMWRCLPWPHSLLFFSLRRKANQSACPTDLLQTRGVLWLPNS